MPWIQKFYVFKKKAFVAVIGKNLEIVDFGLLGNSGPEGRITFQVMIQSKICEKL